MPRKLRPGEGVKQSREDTSSRELWGTLAALVQALESPEACSGVGPVKTALELVAREFEVPRDEQSALVGRLARRLLDLLHGNPEERTPTGEQVTLDRWTTTAALTVGLAGTGDATRVLAVLQRLAGLFPLTGQDRHAEVVAHLVRVLRQELQAALRRGPDPRPEAEERMHG